MHSHNRLIDRVAVICIGNICRSPMGEALLREGLRTRAANVEVTSAGLRTMDGQPADHLAIKLMAERGLDIATYRSTQFSPADSIETDLILVMSEEMRDSVVGKWPLLQGRVYPLGHWGKYDIDDPYMRGEKAFRKALKLIDSGVAQWLEKIA